MNARLRPRADAEAAQLRIPPHSTEAEQSVLGGLLIEPAAWDKVAGLITEPDFYRFEHQQIFAVVSRRLAAGKPADMVTVFEELTRLGFAQDCGGMPYINDLSQCVPSAANIAAHVEIVRDKAIRRALLAAADDAASLAHRPEDIRTVLDHAQAAIQAVVAKGPSIAPVRPRTLDLRRLATDRAPERQWFIRDWLSNGPSLFAAGGGVGKTLLAQQAATCGALGRSFVGEIAHPFRSLIWACEDDADELWRRQEAISAQLEVPLDAPGDKLLIQSRLGVDSLLMAPSHGELRRTAAFEELRQQVNDEQIDVLWLDNVAHLFGGDENLRGQVTAFINAMAGLVTGRQFAVVLLAHTARQTGSEFAGSAAWENAVRMRWYLGNKLPDQKEQDQGDDAGDARFLCKRKANYSSRDYVRFTMNGGVLVPDQPADSVGGIVSRMSEKRAEEIVVAGFKSLQAMGIAPTDGHTSPDYLPRQIVLKGLAASYSASELGRAMNRLMGSGKFVRGIVGQYANRNPKQGLVLQGEGAA